jgi:hypothetical protein
VEVDPNERRSARRNRELECVPARRPAIALSIPDFNSGQDIGPTRIVDLPCLSTGRMSEYGDAVMCLDVLQQDVRWEPFAEKRHWPPHQDVNPIG